MEGVTQYIPKESTAETLGHIKALVGQGSILGMSYVNEATFDENLAAEHGISTDPGGAGIKTAPFCAYSGWPLLVITSI